MSPFFILENLQNNKVNLLIDSNNNIDLNNVIELVDFNNHLKPQTYLDYIFIFISYLLDLIIRLSNSDYKFRGVIYKLYQNKIFIYNKIFI